MRDDLSLAARQRLIADIVAARHDLAGLAEAHGLSPEQLAAWANHTGNQRLLTGLCVLADLQTQILLSRYRLLAAGRLIKLATDEQAEEDRHRAETSRRACVDLLKLDLKRADVAQIVSALDSERAADVDECDDGIEGRNHDSLRELREAIYASLLEGEAKHDPGRSQGEADVSDGDDDGVDDGEGDDSCNDEDRDDEARDEIDGDGS